jgi:hypothetical protein
MAAFVTAQYAERKHLLAAVPAALAACALATELIQFASDDPRRRHDDTTTTPALAAALALAVAALGVRMREAALPVAADCALTAAVLLAVIAAQAFTRYERGVLMGAAVSASTLSFVEFFPWLPWLAQVALQSAVVLLPTLYAWLGYRTTSSDISAFVALVVTFVVYRYLTKRWACQQFVAMAGAQHAVAATTLVAEGHSALLAGLLPPHAIGALGLTRSEAGAMLRKRHNGLSLVQAALRLADGGGFAALVEAWRCLGECVADSRFGALQMVETAGDAFLVAGPFDRVREEECQAAAHAAVAFVRQLQAQLAAQRCAFTAVATAGTAIGALLGASGLTYRLFGPAVRESNALLAAAPAAVPAATQQCTAFATEGFRRQHANFGVAAVAARAPKNADAAMSLAMASESAAAALDREHFFEIADGNFGAAANWRIRGVGVMRVSPIVHELPSPTTGSERRQLLRWHANCSDCRQLRDGCRLRTHVFAQ